MRDAPFSILAIFAHPDDEVGSGSTLSYYSGAGVLINLTTASRGEAATIYCEDCATRENLAEVRTRELACACGYLGVAELRWLDWPDGGIKDLPRQHAIGQVVNLIREFQPDVILTHPEHGLYPHPDHLKIWEVTRAAFDAAGDPAQYPQAGPAWSPARLFTRVIPQSFFDAAPAFAAYRVQLKGEQLPFFSTPDEAVDVLMEVACCVEHRVKAWDCHRSQHNPEGAFSQMPDEVRQAMWENEYYVLAASRVPLPDSPRPAHDLFAGLDAWTSHPAEESDYAGVLRSNLAVRRAYLKLAEEYVQTAREPHFISFLRDLPDREQEFLYVLARALRRADGAPGEVAPDERVLVQGRACRSALSQIQFLLVAARHAVARYQELLDLSADDEQRATWEELLPLARERLAALNEMVGL